MQLKNDYRETRDLLDMCENDVADFKRQCNEKDEEITKLKKQIANLSTHTIDSDDSAKSSRKEVNHEEVERLKIEIRELRQELSEVSMSEYEGLEAGRIQRIKKASDRKENECQIDADFRREVDHLRAELDGRKKEFEKERLIWAQEKEKVLRYQRQLQMNYVQMYRRTRALEDEVESLTIELELDKTGHKKKLSSSDLTQTIEL